jgi:tetratricopeptide (TPR) repeat protein
MNELNSKIHDKILEICSVGEKLSESENYPDAIIEYWKAFDLLPDPKLGWDAALWILAAIGDANFLNKDYVACRDNLSNAMHCPGGIGNPFLHLRLGQSWFELKNYEKSADELARAYMGAGYEIFESENPIYFKFLKTRLKPPVDGWEDEKKNKPWWKIL